MAEVWMDEYKEYLYNRKPHYRNIDAGDLTAQKAVRDKWNCKPFKWFIENIAFDLPQKYPPVEPDDFAKGEVCIKILSLIIEYRILNILLFIFQDKKCSRYKLMC